MNRMGKESGYERGMVPVSISQYGHMLCLIGREHYMTEAFSKQMSEEGPEKVSNNLEELLNEAREFYSNQASANSTIVTPQEEKIFEIISAHSIKETKDKMNDDIDIAVVDMKLDKTRDNAGEDVVNYFTDLCLRIPVYIYTATDADIVVNYYKKYKKGERNFGHILIDCYALSKTGIISLIKKKGLIDQKILDIFQKNLIRSLKESNWLKYALIDSRKTEKALLRYTLNHMQQFLDEDEEKYYPEEVYIYPPIKQDLQTGCVVQCLKTDTYLLVISPACDLANKKTERIQLLEIESLKETIDIRCKKNEDNQDKLKKNTYALFYHYLPKTGFFPGGFINFRRIHSVKPRQMKKFFSSPQLQISPSFCKDIVSRFSSYYARQGQPFIEEENVE